MSYLVRKISRSKWPSSNFDQILMDDIPADALSNCMKTSMNTLSTWEIESLESIEDAVLALIASGDHVDTIHIVYLERDKMEECGLQIIDTKGKTAVSDLVDTHKDVAALNYKSVGIFADLILSEIKENKEKRYSKKQLIQLLNHAIESGRLKKEELSIHIQNKLGA